MVGPLGRLRDLGRWPVSRRVRAFVLAAATLVGAPGDARADKAPPPPPSAEPPAAAGVAAPSSAPAPALAPTVPAGDVTVDLYTIGRGPQLFERYGHSLLCVRAASGAADDGAAACVDYGVAEGHDAVDLAWSTLRGRPVFVPVVVGERVALDFFRSEGRSVERQALPLAPTEARALADRLDRDVRERRGYAYHPPTANCATHPRDVIDEATGGKLRAGFDGLGQTTFRQHLEEGLSGRPLALAASTFVCDASSDRPPTPWEAMFLPFALRDGVAARLGVPPTTVAETLNYELPTSPSVGRALYLVLAVALLAVARRAGGARGRLAKAAVGLPLGALALFVDALGLLSVWPETSHTWALVLFWPTDLALPWLEGRALRGYATLRAAVAAFVLAAEVLGVTQQAILPLAILVLLPMLGLRKGAPREPVSSAVLAT